jgi:hypothetical protein
MTDEYEALWDAAEDAYNDALREGDGESPLTRAASVLRDHVEAKLAEVRAERDDLAHWKLCAEEGLADRDRTLAEQAAEIEQIRGHWQFLHDTLQKQIVENDQPNRVKWKGEWLVGPPADCYFSMIRIMQKLAAEALGGSNAK